MKRPLVIVTLAAVAALSGCLPELAVWSPNGQLAVVQDKDGKFYLCDAQGKRLGAPVSGTFAAWLPDSRHLCWVEGLENDAAPQTWKQAASYLPEAESARLAELGEGLYKMMLAGADWGDAEVRLLVEAKAVTDKEVDVIKLYLRDNHWNDLEPKVGQLWGELNRPNVWVLRKGSADAGIKPLAILAGSLDPIHSLRVSPDGKFVAYTTGDPSSTQKKPIRLMVVASDGAAPAREVAGKVSMFPDWTPDGRSLAYVESVTGETTRENLELGSIVSRRIRGDAGELLKDFENTRTLAGLIATTGTRVRCLKDGRIIFSSAEFTLPATQADLPQAGQLFAVDPQRQATITRLIPRSAQDHLKGAQTDFFQLSPDEKRVAFLTDKGCVNVLALDTGDVVLAQGQELPSDYNHMLPSWRPSGELCFLIPGPQLLVVLWADGKIVRTLTALEEEKTGQPAPQK